VAPADTLLRRDRRGRDRPRRPGPARPVRTRVLSSEQFTGWSFVTPGAFIILLFGAAPIVWSMVMSFQHSTLLSAQTPFVGLRNYRQLASDPVVVEAIQHTLVYTALFVPGTMIVGLFLAVAMNRKIRLLWLYRTAAYATMAISTISEAIVFIWLFDPSYGIVNYLLGVFGVPPQQFLNSPSQALYVIVVMTIWGWTGFAVVIYLAALQGIPEEMDEAAAIDGAGAWNRFWHVTLPMLRPTLVLVITLGLIGTWQVFDQVYLLGPNNPTIPTPAYYSYTESFGSSAFGVGAAVAFLLFVLIVVLTVLQRKLLPEDIES